MIKSLIDKEISEELAVKLKVLVVSAEVAPLAKVGGLADVAGSLPKALRASGVDARIVMPGYQMVLDGKNPQAVNRDFTFEVPSAGSVNRTAHLWQADLGEVPVWLIANPDYFGQATESKKVYQAGADAYIFFCRAVLELLENGPDKWVPDVIHINDWHTSLVPVYLRVYADAYPSLKKTATVGTIHNLAYQGEFESGIIPHASLPWDVYHYEKLECYGRANFLKGGIVYSDLVNTVSKTYAREIQTPEYGCRLDGLLRYTDANHRLWGILNGIDYVDFDPATDRRIAANYSADEPSGKAKNKAKLQKMCGLKVSRKTPVIGLVGRLAEQKGLDLIKRVAPKILAQGAQLVVLGTGDPVFEKWFTRLAGDNPDQVFARIGFDAEFAQLVYAGSDFFLMPSRFEPCGLGQMIAVRYGCIPIVRATGGLADTITEFNPATGKGNGFVFDDYTAKAFQAAIERGLAVWRDQKAWSGLVTSAMKEDWSWARSAKEYVRFYKEAIKVSKGNPAQAPA